MACYHPLMAFQKVSGEPVKFCDSAEMSAAWQACRHNNDTYHPIFGKVLSVPCGQCVGCRLTYSRNWAIRCLLEASLYPENSCWFVTLTYNDEHIPHNSPGQLLTRPEGMSFPFCVDVDSGEVVRESTPLVKRDFQLFMKRFRKNLKDHYGVDRIRFFGCGEYGSLSQRCHFHFILFGLPYNRDYFKICKSNRGKHLAYEVLPVQESWCDRFGFSIGFSMVEELSFDSAAYVAGYILKKQKGKNSKEFYRQRNLTPEFSIMSRRPGIAGSYFDMFSDVIYENDSLLRRFGTLDYTPKPPKYFDNLFARHHPDEMNFIKCKRQAEAYSSLQQKLRETGLTEDQYYRKEEDRIKSSCHRSKKI